MRIKNLTCSELTQHLHQHNYDQSVPRSHDFREEFRYVQFGSIHNIRIRNLDHPEVNSIISIWLNHICVYTGTEPPTFTIDEPLLGCCTPTIHFQIDDNEDLHRIEYEYRQLRDDIANDIPLDLVHVYYQINNIWYRYQNPSVIAVDNFIPYNEVNLDKYLDDRSCELMNVPGYIETIIFGSQETIDSLRRCHLIYRDEFVSNGVESYGVAGLNIFYTRLIIAEENRHAYNQFAEELGYQLEYKPNSEPVISQQRRLENEIDLNRLLDLYDLRY